MSRICLYYRKVPERDRWIPGDRFVRPLVRRLVRGKPRLGGVDKVFGNLCLGLDRLGVPYTVNLPFDKLRDADRVAVLGRGRDALNGYDRRNRIVAGIGLMTHPSEWPTLLDDYPVVRYLQLSKWEKDVYEPYFGHACGVCPVGIDTKEWAPSSSAADFEILLYDKVRWERPHYEAALIQPIRDALSRRKITFKEIRYGFYEEEDYRALLRRCAAMIFLCEHESQGLACLQCLSAGVPVLAWDQGRCLDPNRFKWGSPEIPATSVPYFDSRCGERFRTIEEFETTLDGFLDRLGRRSFDPRAYIMENLTVEKCSQRFVDILHEDLGE